MALRLGTVVPDFKAESTQGTIAFHEFIQEHWAILFSHPNDFTPVCTTELGSVASYMPEFINRGVKVLALSCNDLLSHLQWIPDVESANKQGSVVSFPILCDPDRAIATQLGMLDPDEVDSSGVSLAARAVLIVGPDKKLKASILYPASTGRNFAEILRVIDSLQLTAHHSVATPVDWKHGDSCMVLPNFSDDEARRKFPKGFETIAVPSGKGYLRVTPQPDL
ncbi:hypothetical protein GOP47_0015880 [Adiantum capillus-veneris]|uniref:Peroxiredoxin n=1 Tax=Adiantum capillus-veneris TaxID=13818 RepID=A0A9D4ZC15_ADICA|nr:hypothetical protein GOP47_0015880 [Adiantum capillus-veneris]